jgi:hypothetical protein
MVFSALNEEEITSLQRFLEAQEKRRKEEKKKNSQQLAQWHRQGCA